VIAVECYYCGRKDGFGFSCHICGKKFCLDHKLPENHDCPYGYVVYERTNPRQQHRKSPTERVNDAIFYLDKDKRKMKGD
jgi:predicted nucleic acid binding AN1-type Zn finger protein